VADGSVQAAIDGEMRLLEPGVRASAGLLEELLHPGFAEIGASGTLWSRAATIEALTRDPGRAQSRCEVTGMSGVLLAPGIVHLTFTTNAGGRRAHRSSLWRLTGGSWQMYFHQATPVPQG
jgi:hypothetical protein